MRVGLLTLLSLAVPATAGELSLISPIDCDLTGPCYVQQYVDHDPSDAASDFTCTDLSYDGHKGTDFALPTDDMIAAGVDVLAAAADTVSGVRDGVADLRYSSKNAANVEGRECGNGVVIRHADGWETQLPPAPRLGERHTRPTGRRRGHSGRSRHVRARPVPAPAPLGAPQRRGG